MLKAQVSIPPPCGEEAPFTIAIITSINGNLYALGRWNPDLEEQRQLCP